VIGKHVGHYVIRAKLVEGGTGAGTTHNRPTAALDHSTLNFEL
jgi:hypothetical protein